MLIHTAAGWRTITGRPPRPIRDAESYSEVTAKMADELAQLCPALGQVATAIAAASMVRALAF